MPTKDPGDFVPARGLGPAVPAAADPVPDAAAPAVQTPAEAPPAPASEPTAPPPAALD